MVVVAVVSGGDRPRSDKGGVVLRPFQEWKGEGHREAAARVSRRQPVGPGWLAGSAKGQGLVAVWGRRPKRREGRVGQPGWKERRSAAGPNPEPGQNSKEILFEFQLIFRIWQKFGNLHKEV
jgi:hypothetical protein